MTTIDDTTGRLARVYDSATDTWVPLIGSPAPHTHDIDAVERVALTSLTNNDLLKYSSSASAFINSASVTLSQATITQGDVTTLTSTTGNITTVNATDLTSTGLLSINEVTETVVDAAISSGSLTADFTTGNVFYVSASPSANFTINLTNAPTTNGKAITISVLVVQGATGYYPNVFAIAGTTQTLKWVGGTTPTPTSSSGKIDIFNFSLIRRSSAWTVLANSTLNL